MARLPRIRAGVVFGARTALASRRLRAVLLVLGPGLISGFADNDAGGITTYSLVGAQYGYGLMWVLLASMLALGITQEVGIRLGLATGQGLGGLIRERFGVRWTVFAIFTMLAANLGDTVAEFAGIAASLDLFGVPPSVSAIASAAIVVVVLARANFTRIQYVLLTVGAGVSVAYAISAVLSNPDWGAAAHALVVPNVSLDGAYLLAVVGTVGTTITPWGQAFVQSYAADKGLRRSDLGAARLDVTLGALLTNTVAGFIVVACAATLWAHGQRDIASAADAAVALGPLAGRFATILFAAGLLAASLLGLATVPLTSAYAACEAFGFERGLHWRWRQAPAFYGLLTFFVASSAMFIVIPGLPLVGVMFLSQVFDGLLLPIILVFVMLLARDRTIAGDLASGRAGQVLGWLVTGAIGVLSVALVGSLLIGPFLR
jgi:NRAMP (natural resistance-associated macrophage protein)-like metal ion transporter